MREVLKKIKEERKSYKSMIEFCCDSLIPNNEIIEKLLNGGFEFETFCGQDFDEETEVYKDIYQYYLIGEEDAYMLKIYTNEIVYYCEKLDLYLLAVTHFGTAWDYISANWKDEEE